MLQSSFRICGRTVAGLTLRAVERNRLYGNCYVTLIQPAIGINKLTCLVNQTNTVQSLNRIQYYSSATRKRNDNIHMNTIRGKELLKDALEMRKEQFRERKEVLVKDMRQTKLRVREKVKEKIEEMEEIVERENVLTIPNLLCVGRAAMSPYLAYVVIQGDFNMAMGLLMFAGFTDLVVFDPLNALNVNLCFAIPDGWIHSQKLAVTSQ